MVRPAHSEPAFDLLPAALAVVGAVALGIITGLGWAMSSNWTGGQFASLLQAAIVCASVWLIAAIVGMGILYAATNRRIDRLGPAILASSMGRMLTALMLGLAAYFLAAPEGRTFWTCFLLAGLLALMAETVWAIRTLNSLPSNLATPGLAAKPGVSQ